MSRDKIIAVVGTNASGKSALGIHLAQELGGEILSADSRQIFEGFDLCCGKVTAGERALVPHHILDVRRVGEPFSVSDYQALCYELIPQILGRGHVPMIVGGTGLYVSAVVKGYDLQGGDAADEALRAELEEKSLEELRELLSEAERERLRQNPSDWQNKRRLVRAVERERQGAEPRQNDPRYDCLQLGLTWPPEVLAKRIDIRLDERMKQGMADEVRDYLANGGDRAVMDSLGLEYRFLAKYVSGGFKDESEFRAALAQAIRQFARRQMTWFRRDESIRWLDASGDYKTEALRLCREFLAE